MALVVPRMDREDFKEIMGLNGDKNYLTDLELAALADNHLADPSVDGLVELLSRFNVPTDSNEAQVVLRRAIILTHISREGV